MLSEYNKVVLDDLKGKRKVEMEVNFTEKEGLKDCVRVKMGKEEAYIPISDLYGFIFVIMDEERQSQMIPVRHTVVHKYVKQHRIKTTKKVEAGEFINVMCEIDVPTTIVDGIKNSKLFSMSKFL